MSGYGITTGFALAPLVDKSKGSAGNRIDCAGAHMKNNIKQNVKTMAVGAGVAGVSYAAVKNKDVAKLGAKGLQKIVKAFAKLGQKVNLPKLTFHAYKTSLRIARNPAGACIAAAVAIGTAAFAKITHTHAYNAGRIDAKYEARANAQNVA